MLVREFHSRSREYNSSTIAIQCEMNHRPDQEKLSAVCIDSSIIIVSENLKVTACSLCCVYTSCELDENNDMYRSTDNRDLIPWSLFHHGGVINESLLRLAYYVQIKGFSYPRSSELGQSILSVFLEEFTARLKMTAA